MPICLSSPVFCNAVDRPISQFYFNSATKWSYSYLLYLSNQLKLFTLIQVQLLTGRGRYIGSMNLTPGGKVVEYQRFHDLQNLLDWPSKSIWQRRSTHCPGEPSVTTACPHELHSEPLVLPWRTLSLAAANPRHTCMFNSAWLSP